MTLLDWQVTEATMDVQATDTAGFMPRRASKSPRTKPVATGFTQPTLFPPSPLLAMLITLWLHCG